MRVARTVCLTLLLAAGLAASARAAETHPFTIHDMLAMDRISEHQVSPDGKTVVFVLRTTDLEANRGRTDLWLVQADGTGLRQLTAHPAGDSNPVWAPDSRSIYFLSTRSGSSQVWRIAVDGGEAQPVTRLPLDVSNLLISPDGKSLAFSLEVFPDAETIQETADRLAKLEKRQASGMIYDRLFIRHWDTWLDGRRNHVFVLPAAGGEPVDVMAKMDADSPSKPFGGPEEVAFAPDGKGVVFTAKDAGREEAWSTNYDLFYAPADGSAPPRNLTAANKAWDTQPKFSPDGKTMAWLAMARPGFEADRYRIMLQAWPDGTPHPLAEGWDRSPQSLAWSTDGKSLYVTADNFGQTALFAVDAATGQAKLVVEKGTAAGPQPAGDRIVYELDTLNSPVEIFSVKPDGTDARPVTRINADRVAVARMGRAEQYTFPGWNNETVYGYVITPSDFDPAKKYPVAFLIHGGPQGSFGNHFHYRWNPQAYCGAGYAVVMVDFHGSTGYGQAFTDAISDHWGDRPLEDLQKGLAAATAKYPWLDGDRVAALGASYGGYMINWIAGNWPDRFRCLICHDGNLDERAAYYDTEELWFPEWDHAGTPWDNPTGYAKHNPADYVARWKTPTLVIHGGKDYRVVDTQGISTFTALQRRGIPSKFLYFPDENHWVLKPANSILWHDTVLGWMDQWTKK